MSQEATLQTSRICYVPQPYFLDTGSCTVTDHGDVDQILNPEGMLDPDLSKFTTIIADKDATEFNVRVGFNKKGDWLSDADMSVAFIGCAMETYEDDGGGNPDLTTKFSENIVMSFNPNNIGENGNQQLSYAHNSQNTISTFCDEPLPGIISGGTANLVFHDLGKSKATEGVLCSFGLIRQADDVTARPHARFIVGHMFIGIDLVINMNPNSFAWRLAAQSDKFKSRDEGALSTEGTLVRRSSGQILRIPTDDLIGSTVTQLDPSFEFSDTANFFDLIKVNNSYPVLFSPYPRSGLSAASPTVELMNLTARQNFFAIYGFLDGSIEFITGDFSDGINSQYKANFRITETR